LNPDVSASEVDEVHKIVADLLVSDIINEQAEPVLTIQ